MSKYTTELRYICEEYSGLKSSVGCDKIEDVIEVARKKIFSFNYPIFSEEYRATLETKIIKHFYTREIGLETVGLWKLKLNAKMNEIMPYYNKIYLAVEQDFNPLFDTDITTTREIKDNGTKTDTGKTTETENFNNEKVTQDTTTNNGKTTTSDTGKRVTDTDTNHWDYYSDTPQGGVNGLAAHNYLTNARNVTDVADVTENTTANGTVTDDSTSQLNGNVDESGRKNRDVDNKVDTVTANTQDYVEHVVGKRGGQSYATLIKDFVESLVNIDVMIIGELEELFMGLW